MSSSSLLGAVGAGQSRDYSGYYVFPASPAQRQLWFLAQLEPASGPAYNVVSTVRMRGVVNRLWLQQALNAVVARHESLRTGVALVDGEIQQVVLPSALVTLPLVDCTALPPKEQETRVRRVLRGESAAVFPLHEPPLLRIVLIRLGADEHLLVVTIHHLVCDGWSMELFFQDLAESYRLLSEGEPADLPVLPIQYADYVVWQEEQLADGRLEQLLGYWRDKLAGTPPLDLPTDRPRPEIRTMRGGLCAGRLPADLVERLTALGQDHNATLFMVLLTAYQLLLARWSGQHSISVGTPVAGRRHPDAERLIGFFANTLVVLSEFGDDPSFAAALDVGRVACVEAFAHQDMPFDRLVEELRPPRELSRTPLFQTMFLLQNTPGVTLELPDLSIEPVEPGLATAKFELWLTAVPDPSGLRLRLEYNRDLFDEATMARLMDRYRALLEAAAADPDRTLSRLVPVDDDERALLTGAWARGPRRGLGTACVHSSLPGMAERTPSAPAVSAPDGTLTRAELWERSGRLARTLQATGVGPETVVAVAPRCTRDLAVAALAVFRAGAALGPADVASLVITGAEPDVTPDVTPDETPEEPLDTARIAGRAAFVTSDGTTFTHRSLVHAVAAALERIGVTETDVVAVLSGVDTPAGVVALLLPLTAGARLLLPSDDDVDAWERAGVARPPAVSRVLYGGDPQADERAERLADSGVEVEAPCGPAEAAAWDLLPRGRGNARPVLGAPALNVSRYLFDARMEPVPIGAVGELYIGGAGLPRNRGAAGRTAELLLPDPFAENPGARLARTGWLGRYIAGGRIELVGRARRDGRQPAAGAAALDDTAPRDHTERAVAEIFQRVLKVERVGVRANFFVIGGHSMLAAKVMADVWERFGVSVPVRDFFREPTVAGLAAAVTAARADRSRRSGETGALSGLSDDEVERLLGQLH